MTYYRCIIANNIRFLVFTYCSLGDEIKLNETIKFKMFFKMFILLPATKQMPVTDPPTTTTVTTTAQTRGNDAELICPEHFSDI